MFHSACHRGYSTCSALGHWGVLAEVLILTLCFLFQRYTRSRDEKAAKELERLQETDQSLRRRVDFTDGVDVRWFLRDG